MFQALRKHLTPSTLIAFVALVFAMTGGAFAASSGGGGTGAKATASVTHGTQVATAAKSKTRPRTKAGPRGPAGSAGKAGVNGAAGATGPAGPAGTVGPTGAGGPQGAAGTNGTNGESAKVESAAATECNKEGGVKVSNTSGSGTVCNGKTGFTETLPEGKTEMGAWSVSVAPQNPTTKTSISRATVSFVIPLAVHVTDAHILAVNEGETPECPGTAEAPKAAEGQLCLYKEGELDPPGTFGVTSHTVGFVLTGNGGEPGGFVNGTWAVTAE